MVSSSLCFIREVLGTMLQDKICNTIQMLILRWDKCCTENLTEIIVQTLKNDKSTVVFIAWIFVCLRIWINHSCAHEETWCLGLCVNGGFFRLSANGLYLLIFVLSGSVRGHGCGLNSDGKSRWQLWFNIMTLCFTTRFCLFMFILK